MKWLSSWPWCWSLQVREQQLQMLHRSDSSIMNPQRANCFKSLTPVCSVFLRPFRHFGHEGCGAATGGPYPRPAFTDHSPSSRWYHPLLQAASAPSRPPHPQQPALWQTVGLSHWSLRSPLFHRLHRKKTISHRKIHSTYTHTDIIFQGQDFLQYWGTRNCAIDECCFEKDKWGLHTYFELLLIVMQCFERKKYNTIKTNSCTRINLHTTWETLFS